MNHGHHPSATDIQSALELATGEPELVVVDARVLRLLMGDLASLIILRQFGSPGRHRAQLDDPDPYVWDETC